MHQQKNSLFHNSSDNTYSLRNLAFLNFCLETGALFENIIKAISKNTKGGAIVKKILILNGSPRKQGKTTSLVNAFIQGAESAGNEVRDRYLTGMDIHGCLACEACSRNGGTCVQKDDMEQIYEDYLWADVIVFASPMYWGYVSGQLKTAVDRLYAIQNRIGYSDMSKQFKETVFIMTARGGYYKTALTFYSIFTDIMGWKSWGTILGAGKEEEAGRVGASIH